MIKAKLSAKAHLPFLRRTAPERTTESHAAMKEIVTNAKDYTCAESSANKPAISAVRFFDYGTLRSGISGDTSGTPR